MLNLESVGRWRCVAWVVAATAALGANAVGIVDDHVIGYWMFDGNGGDVAADSSTNGNDGDILNGEWTEGMSGAALLFDGDSTRVEILDDDALHPATGDITMEAWIRPDSTPVGWGPGASGAGGILFKQDAYQWVVHGGNSGALWFGIWGARLESTGNWHATDHVGEWHHVVLTFEGASQETKIYVDGELNTDGVVGEAVDPTASPLYIGFKADDGVYFQGAIDEVRVSDVVRTQAEIQKQIDTSLAVDAVGKLATQWARLKR